MASSRNLVAASILLWVATAVAATATADDERGEQLYQICAPCHGEAGQGNHELGAPAIAGLGQWYVEAQVTKFRDGIRGAHPDDAEGMRMRPMARVVGTDENIATVAAYVAAMPPVEPEKTLEGGDAARGAALYKTCTACHGVDGRGNPQLNAPPQVHLNDWYMLKQLQKFKAGVRGANPQDTAGVMMRPMSMTLVDEQAMKDVIAYIMSLPN